MQGWRHRHSCWNPASARGRDGRYVWGRRRCVPAAVRKDEATITYLCVLAQVRPVRHRLSWLASKELAQALMRIRAGLVHGL